MNLRLAVMEDLQQLKDMYKRIIKDMENNALYIWDEVYPCEFLGEDIKRNQFYVLVDNDEIISAFALCNFNAGANSVNWKNNHATALYIDRFGVNANYSRKGIGSYTLNKAKELSREMGIEYLRLFVVDANYPAINLYKKVGFEKVDGVYEEVIEEGLILHEFGFEIKIKV